MRSQLKHVKQINPKSLSRFDRKRSLLYAVIAAVALAGASMIAVTQASRHKATVTDKPSPAAVAQPGGAAVAMPQVLSPNRLEAERITLRPTGFEPAEINRPAGRFLLAVNNRSGSDDVSLTLVRETGQRLHATRMRDNPRKYEWRQLVNLAPGNYVLSATNHPEWACRITITAN